MNLFVGQSIAEGKYTLIRVLGKGTQGEVWEAKQQSHEGFSKSVVLKFQLQKETNDPNEQLKAHELRQMFSNEALLTAKLHHPNIVQAYDFGKEKDLDYIAMEYIQGKELKDVLACYQHQHNAPLPWELVLPIISQVCQGLHFAHTQIDQEGKALNLIHRDLKPANILLDSNGFIKIIDFGIAKASTTLGQTATNIMKGTPCYLSPEQISRPKKMDSRSDIFALGSIFYELCSGKRAFEQEELHALTYAIVHYEPEPINQHIPNFPIEIASILNRMLEREPNKRYQNAQEVRKDLKQTSKVLGSYLDQDDLTDLYHSLFSSKPVLSQRDEPTLRLPGLRHSKLPQRTPPLPTGISPSSTSQPSAEKPYKNAQADRLASEQSMLVSEKTSTLSSFPLSEKIPSQYPSPQRSIVQNNNKKLFSVLIGSSFAVLLTLGFWFGREKPKINPPILPAEKAVPKRNTAQKRKILETQNPTKQMSFKEKMVVPSKQQPKKKVIAPPKQRSKKIQPKQTTLNEPNPKPLQEKSHTRREPSKVKTQAHPTTPKIKIAPRKPTYGFAIIRIQPSCQLYKNGQKMGWANGKQKYKLTPQAIHQFQCRHRKKNIRHSFRLKVKANQSKIYRKTLRKGKFWFFSTPWATAKLKAFGSSLEQQIWHTLYEGRYRITFYQGGQKRQRKTLHIRVRPKKKTRCILNWKKKSWKCQ